MNQKMYSLTIDEETTCLNMLSFENKRFDVSRYGLFGLE